MPEIRAAGLMGVDLQPPSPDANMKEIDKKIFGALFFSIFSAVTGVGIVVPLLPVYAHDLGASGMYIGMIFGAFSLSRTLFLPYFGRLSDQKGRKPLIVPGLFAYALISIAFVYAESVESLIVIRFFQGIASAMIMPAAQAYVGDITPSGREGYAMGLFNMSMFTGLSIGPLIGGFLKDHFALSASFVSMGVLALVGFFLSLLLLPPVKSEAMLGAERQPVAWKKLLSDRDIAGLVLFRFAYVVCIGIIWGFVPVYADSKFSLSSSSIGFVIMLGVLISGMIHAPMGYLADKTSKRLMVLIGGMIVGYSLLSYGGASSYRELVRATIFFGIGGGISMPALMALAVFKGNKTGAMGSVMALLTAAHSLGMLAGSLLAGLMMDFFQLRQAFQSGAAVMLLALGLFTVLTHSHK